MGSGGVSLRSCQPFFLLALQRNRAGIARSSPTRIAGLWISCHGNSSESKPMTEKANPLYKPVCIVPQGDMVNTQYSLEVWAYMFGQFRTKLYDHNKPDSMTPNGASVVRECCTYLPTTQAQITLDLSRSHDPEALLTALERPWNCEGKGGRIRLDNKPEDAILYASRSTKQESPAKR